MEDQVSLPWQLLIEEYFLFCFLSSADIFPCQGGCDGNHLYWFQLSWQKGNTLVILHTINTCQTYEKHQKH